MTDKVSFGECTRVKTQQELDDMYAAGYRSFYIAAPGHFSVSKTTEEIYIEMGAGAGATVHCGGISRVTIGPYVSAVAYSRARIEMIGRTGMKVKAKDFSQIDASRRDISGSMELYDRSTALIGENGIKCMSYSKGKVMPLSEGAKKSIFTQSDISPKDQVIISGRRFNVARKEEIYSGTRIEFDIVDEDKGFLHLAGKTEKFTGYVTGWKKADCIPVIEISYGCSSGSIVLDMDKANFVFGA